MKSISKLLHFMKSSECVRITKGDSPIFKLNIDCLEEIFEWLSLEDVHSISQTCSWFRHVVGFYFRQNYQSIEINNSKDGIYTEYSDIGQLSHNIYLSNFTKFIENLTHTYNNSKSLHRLKSSQIQYSSLNKMSFLSITLNRSYLECIKSSLCRIEILKMYDCRFEGDFYECFLKFCKHLKRLHLQDVDLTGYEYNVGYSSNQLEQTNKSRHHWLLKTYPMLEHFQLTPWNRFIINELKTFFIRNPNISSFSTNSNCLFQNWATLIETNTKLDSLAVDLNYWPRIHLPAMCDAMNSLHKNGFFEKLFLYASYLDKISSDHIIMLNALEILYVKYLRQSENLHLFTNLRELGIFEGSDVMDMELVAQSLINIERVYLEYGSSDDVLAFVRYSSKLKQIKVMSLKERSHMKLRVLDLKALDQERQKLIAAHKVTIYVKENLFLKTKWNKGRTNYKLITLKRIESCKWEHPFEF